MGRGGRQGMRCIGGSAVHFPKELGDPHAAGQSWANSWGRVAPTAVPDSVPGRCGPGQPAPAVGLAPGPSHPG